MSYLDIVAASDDVRAYHFASTSPSTHRLPWSGFKVANARNAEQAFFAAVYSAAKAIAFRFPTALTAESSTMDYGSWFNYFFRETQVARKSAEDELFIGRMFSLIFDYEIDGAGNSAKLKAVATSISGAGERFRALLQTQPGGIPRSILDYLFKRGFQQASMADADKMFSPSLDLIANVNATPELIKKAKGHFVFAYRGDKRTPQTVISHGGAQCRASLEFWRRDAQVDQPWHPWSTQQASTTRQMWFRMGKGENDYFTLNSIAYNLHVSCGYPIFRSDEIVSGAKGPVAGWTGSQRDKAIAADCTISMRWNRVSSAWDMVLMDVTNVYVCLLRPKDQVATTWTLNDYPESAVRNINLEDILACFRVQRIHHPPAADQTYESSETTTTCRILDWDTVQPRNVVRASLGCTEAGMQSVYAKLDAMKGKEFDITIESLVPGASRYDTARVGPPVPPARWLSNPAPSPPPPVRTVSKPAPLPPVRTTAARTTT